MQILLDCAKDMTTRPALFPSLLTQPLFRKEAEQHALQLAGYTEVEPGKVKIHKGYHIYAQVADSNPFVMTTVKIHPAEGAVKTGGLRKPAAQMDNSNGTMVCKDEAIFRQEISGEGDITCMVDWQCCNETICMPLQKCNCM